MVRVVGEMEGENDGEARDGGDCWMCLNRGERVKERGRKEEGGKRGQERRERKEGEVEERGKI